MTQLTPEQEKRALERMNQLFNEKRFKEGAEIAVALAVVKIDPKKFVDGLMVKIREFKKAREDELRRASQVHGDT